MTMQPIVISNGLPINPAVWNICYYFNKKYNTNLVIRCIVPVNMEIKNCISYNISRFKENCSSYTEQRKSIPKKYRDKTSLLILSTMDWLLNNKPI
jgi:acetoacetate decarboxylase